MPKYYVARFKGTKGRYLVAEEAPGSYGGQRILDRRQEKYGNPPDPATGLYLHEAYRSFDAREVVRIQPFVRKPYTTDAAMFALAESRIPDPTRG